MTTLMLADLVCAFCGGMRGLFHSGCAAALQDYRDILTYFADDALEREIITMRGRLAKWDETFARCREEKIVMGDDAIAEAAEVRTKLRLAERALVARYGEQYGSCPMSWPEEE